MGNIRLKSALVIVALILGLYLVSQGFRVGHVFQAIGRGQFANAMVDLKFLVFRPVAFGAYQIGGLYRRGRIVDEDQREAARWYRLSADLDYAPGQVALGQAYWTGRGVKKNVTLAEIYFINAQTQAYVPAVYHLYKVMRSELEFAKPEEAIEALLESNLIDIVEGRPVPQDEAREKATAYLRETRIILAATAMMAIDRGDRIANTEWKSVLARLQFGELDEANKRAEVWRKRHLLGSEERSMSCAKVGGGIDSSHDITVYKFLCLENVTAKSLPRHQIPIVTDCMRRRFESVDSRDIFETKLDLCLDELDRL